MTEQSHQNKMIDLWKALTAIAVVGSTLAGAGWMVGRVHLQDEIAQYKESAKWKAPDAIQKISSLSETLRTQIESINDYDALKKHKEDSLKEIEKLRHAQGETIKSHKKGIEDLKNQYNINISEINKQQIGLKNKIESIQTRNTKLNKIIEGLRGETVVVNLGNAESVGHKSIRVGVNRTTPLYNYAEVTSGEYDNSSMKVGDNFSRIVGDKKYVITLITIDKAFCKFSFDVFESK